MGRFDSRKWISNEVEFKVGDKVRVMRRTEDGAADGMGTGVRWQNNWVLDEDGGNRGMDAYLGLTFEIEEITLEGVEFVGSVAGISFLFPLASLDKVVK